MLSIAAPVRTVYLLTEHYPEKMHSVDELKHQLWNYVMLINSMLWM